MDNTSTYTFVEASLIQHTHTHTHKRTLTRTNTRTHKHTHVNTHTHTHTSTWVRSYSFTPTRRANVTNTDIGRVYRTMPLIRICNPFITSGLHGNIIRLHHYFCKHGEVNVHTHTRVHIYTHQRKRAQTHTHTHTNRRKALTVNGIK